MNCDNLARSICSVKAAMSQPNLFVSYNSTTVSLFGSQLPDLKLKFCKMLSVSMSCDQIVVAFDFFIYKFSSNFR